MDEPGVKLPSLEVTKPSLAGILPSPEYVASAVWGEPDPPTGEVTLQVATPPDIAMVFVVRSSHWTGPEPLMKNDTVPVGVPAPDGSPVTTARNVGVVEPRSVTTNRVVRESDWGEDAAGDESHTIAAGARTKAATSVRTTQRKIRRDLT